MEAPTIICVLGGPADAEGRPKAHLALRLDTALAEAAKLEATGAAHRFLLTGGAVKSYGSAGVVTEASSMARYLTERGVPASARKPSCARSTMSACQRARMKAIRVCV